MDNGQWKMDNGKLKKIRKIHSATQSVNQSVNQSIIKSV